MPRPLPGFAQKAYAILWCRFRAQAFGVDHLRWYLSTPMVKKTLHVLEQGGWIERKDRGQYACVPPELVFTEMVRLRVPELLSTAGRPYAYAAASAVEIWTDFTYLQRSWEHSPYFVSVLHGDVESWKEVLRKERVRVFVESAAPALGEFVVLLPQHSLEVVTHEGMPVVPLAEVIAFCERHVGTFEYTLAYLTVKFGVHSDATLDPRVMEEARAHAT